MSFFSDASLVMIPSGYKTSKVYSVVPTSGDGDLVFSRSNDTATRVNSAGLIEKVRTNLQTYSQNFSNAVWIKSAGATLTHSQTDPNGGTTASRLQMPSGTSNFFAATAITGLTNGGQYTHSIYMKSNTGSTQSVRILDGVRGAAGGLLLASVTTSWQRFEVVITTASTSAGLQIDNVAGTYNNDILIAFAQTEVSDFGPTPYIATTSAAVSVGPVANVPRLDYLNSSCPRLLLEPQRTNIAIYSEQIDNAAWVKVQITTTANSSASPDGYANADKIAINNGISGGYAYQSIATTSSTIYTSSFFIKAAGVNFTKFYSNVTGSYVTAVINLTTGAITNSGFAVTPTATNYGNGWWRVSYTETSGGGSVPIYVDAGSTSNGGAITGNGTDGILIWGAQVEAGAYATSYIPTLGAAVTRGADACSKTGISSLIGQTEGTLFAEFVAVKNTAFSDIASLGTSGATLVELQFNGGTNILSGIYYAGGPLANIPTLSALTIGQTYKVAFAYKTNDFVMYLNGVQQGVDTSGTIVAGMAEVSLNGYGGGTNNSENAIIKQALVFTTRLTNAQLAELTTI